jgi:Ser/Thr protein kinase RdoA (MazF antagonist)
MSFLDGKPLSSITDISVNLFKNAGEAVALYNQAMRDFDHPAARRDHRWNLATAGRHELGVAGFDEPDRRSLLKWAFRGWHAMRGRLERLPWQFIHGDAHDENLLVQGERVSGLVDFGDCGHNPAICDLAICLTYLMMRDSDPLFVAAVVTEGYRSVRPVSGAELAALYPLICARLAVSLCVARERAAIDPTNPNWFGDVKSTWLLLQRLREIGDQTFIKGL